MKKFTAAKFYWYTLPLIISAYYTCAAGAVEALLLTAAAAAAVAVSDIRNAAVLRLALAVFLSGAAGIPAMTLAKDSRQELIAHIKANPEVQDAVVTISDSECSPASRFLAPPPYMRARVTAGGRTFEAYVSARERDLWPFPPGWGDTFRINGSIRAPGSLTQLPSITADDALLIRRGGGIFRQLLDLRDRIMDHVTGGFGDSPEAEKARGVAAALIFGCCQGVSREVMDDFVLTGTIHILSVSGLHIGVLALAVSMILMILGIKFRARCFLAPAVLLPYLIMTGCSIPAMRAWLMFTAWSLCRSMLYRTPPVRILILLAAATALAAPLDLFNMGFQYSFAVTAALLLLIPVMKEFHSLAEAERRWMLPYRTPAARSPRLDRMRRGAVNTFAAAAAAFAAGMPLTLFYHGKTAFAAVLLNVLISPLLPLAYIGALLAVLLPFSWSGSICMWTVDLMVDVIGIAGKDALVPDGLGKPGWILCTAGVAGALLMLTSGAGKKLRLPGFLLFLFFLAGCFLKPFFMEPGILVILPAYSAQPTVAACHPAFYSRRGILLAGEMDWESRTAAEEFFFANGITEIESLTAAGISGGTWYQLRRLAAAVPVKSIRVLKNMRKSSPALTAAAAIAPAGIIKISEPAGEFFGRELRTSVSGSSCQIIFDGRTVTEIDGISNHTREFFIPLPELRIP